MIVMTTIIMMAGRIWFHILISSRKTNGGYEHIDELDAGEGHGDPAQAIDQEIAAQDGGRSHRAIGNATQSKRDERDDDQRVEDDRRQDGALGRRETHDVERLKLRIEG